MQGVSFTGVQTSRSNHQATCDVPQFMSVITPNWFAPPKRRSSPDGEAAKAAPHRKYGANSSVPVTLCHVPSKVHVSPRAYPVAFAPPNSTTWVSAGSQAMDPEYRGEGGAPAVVVMFCQPEAV